MAERRMFSKSILDSDLFLDMPLSSQALYMHLAMRADDDGFLNNTKRIVRMLGASEDDLKLLVVKGFVIGFENGILVITHWKQHNYIRKDRYKSTIYTKEALQLQLDDNGVYVKNGLDNPFLNSSNHKATNGIPQDNQTETDGIFLVDTGKGRLGKVRLGKDRKEICTEPLLTSDLSDDLPTTEPPILNIVLNDKSYYPVTREQVDLWVALYPAVDVLQELRKMVGWCDANPTKRKTKRGVKSFITSWLAKEQDRGGNSGRYINSNTKQDATRSQSETSRFGYVAGSNLRAEV